MTSPGTDAWRPSLSRDGKKLAFSGNRGGNNMELRETSLSDGREVPIVADDFYSRYFPQWSPDGAYLAYTREEPSGEGQLMMWSSQSRTEEPLTTSSRTDRDAYDWSGDGKWLLISQENSATGRRRSGYCLWPPGLMQKRRRKKLLPARSTLFISATSLPMVDGSSLKLREANPGHEIHTVCNGCDSAGRGFASRTASIGTISLAGHRMERRYILSPVAAASSMCGASASMRSKESPSEIPSR